MNGLSVDEESSFPAFWERKLQILLNRGTILLTHRGTGSLTWKGTCN